MKYLLIALLSFSAHAEAPVVWSGSYAKSIAASGFKHKSNKAIIDLSVDPSAGAGYSASIGSIGQRNNAGVGEMWIKDGAADTAWTLFPTSSGGGVTSISIATANGFSGSSSGGATPALTIGTTISGILKGNGTAMSAAVSGTDYAPATSGSSILKGNGAGGFSNASAGTDYEVPITFSTGLTRAVNTVTVNTTQNITTLSGLTTDGIVYTSGGTGALNSGPLTGDVTTSGLAATIANLAVTNGKIANGTIDLTTKVTGILPNANTTATNANTASAIVARDASGNFSAGTITASLTGTASGNEVPLTFSTGLTRTVDTITVNTSQNISTLSNLTTNGYVKTSGGTGALSVQTTPIPVADGGTNQSSYTDGQLLIGNSTGNTLTKSTLTAGSGISITNGGGSITIAATGGGGGSSVTPNEVYLNVGAGHGSTNTKVRRYTNIKYNKGTYFSVSQSAANGDKLTVSQAGSYMFCAADTSAANPTAVAIAVNGAAGTTNATSLTYANGKRAVHYTANSANGVNVCWFGILAANDYVWVQDDGSNSDASEKSYFFGVYLGAGTDYAYLENGNGYGSTNTKIRRYSNDRGSSGITVTQSATNGDSMTVASTGMYAACTADAAIGIADVAPIGITVNDTAMTTNISSMDYSQGVRAYFNVTTNDEPSHVCTIFYLTSGDIVRSHHNATANETTQRSYLFLTQLTTTESSHQYLYAGSAHGSASTKVRTFVSNKSVSGSDIQLKKSSLYGGRYQIRTDGTYVICYADQFSGGNARVGIVLNGENVTTNLSAPITYAEEGLRAQTIVSGSSYEAQACFGATLYQGDVLSAWDDGANNATAERNTHFNIIKVR